MMSEDQQKEIVETSSTRRCPTRELVSFDVTSALALFSPMEVDFEIKVPNAAPKTGDYRLLRSLVTSGSLGLVENALPQVLGAHADAQVRPRCAGHVRVRPDRDDHAARRHQGRRAAERDAVVEQGLADDVVVQEAGCDDDRVQARFQLKSRHIDPTQYKTLRGSLASLALIAHQPVILAAEASEMTKLALLIASSLRSPPARATTSPRPRRRRRPSPTTRGPRRPHRPRTSRTRSSPGSSSSRRTVPARTSIRRPTRSSRSSRMTSRTSKTARWSSSTTRSSRSSTRSAARRSSRTSTSRSTPSARRS